MSAKKILMVLTSHSMLGDTGDTTGFWIEEFAAPYYRFLDSGAEITIASPLGGQPPIDPKSALADFQTSDTQRFDTDKTAQALVANSHPLTQINATDFDGVFYPGGHGPLWDLVKDVDSIALIEAFEQQNKPIAAVCHASAVLLGAKNSEGRPIVAGKITTGFSNSEEDAVQLTDVVPFLLEDELKKLGAHYQKGGDWLSYVVTDGLLITGQNPASSAAAAEKLLESLAK